jgi:hypothetical protein
MFNLQEIKDIIYSNPDMSIEEKNSVILGSIQSRLAHLKSFLLETDWKVIVNSELVQAGLEQKYPNLHTERQVWRDEINQLEQQINSLQNN